MKSGFWVTLSNAGGPLDRIFAETEEQAREAVLVLIRYVPNLTDGDTITVVAGESEQD